MVDGKKEVYAGDPADWGMWRQQQQQLKCVEPPERFPTPTNTIRWTAVWKAAQAHRSLFYLWNNCKEAGNKTNKAPNISFLSDFKSISQIISM